MCADLCELCVVCVVCELCVVVVCELCVVTCACCRCGVRSVPKAGIDKCQLTTITQLTGNNNNCWSTNYVNGSTCLVCVRAFNFKSKAIHVCVIDM